MCVCARVLRVRKTCLVLFVNEKGVCIVKMYAVSIVMNEKSFVEYCVRRKPAKGPGGSGMVGH